MRIIINEMKKILNWKMLLVLACVNLVLYYFLIDFDIKYYPNGRPATDSYRIGVEMVDQYGVRMDETEIAAFKKEYEEEVQKADHFLQARDDAQKAGITTYEAFQNMEPGNKSADELHSTIMFDEGVNLFWELQERERLIEFHDMKDEIIQNDLARFSENQRERLRELQQAGNYEVYPEVAVMNYKSMIRSIAIVVLISVVLLVSPLLIRDRSLRLLDLQYTAKIGRPIFKKKVAAALISSFIVMTGLLAVYLALYSKNDPAPFFHVPMDVFIGAYHWYDLTFLHYIILTVLAIYGLGFVIVLVSIAISNLAPSYITLIGLHVPIVFLLLAFGLRYLVDMIVTIYLPQWFVPLCYSALLAASMLIIVRLWRREKRKDVLM